MNIELDPIASYHHHLPDSWSSKAHQASWESLVSGCVPPLTDPHRKRGRSSRIGHPIPSVYVVLSPLLRGHPFLSWSEHESGLLCTLRAIRHTHTYTQRAKDTQLAAIRSRLDECASSFVVSTTAHAPAETMDALILRQRTSLTTLNDLARAFVMEGRRRPPLMLKRWRIYREALWELNLGKEDFDFLRISLDSGSMNFPPICSFRSYFEICGSLSRGRNLNFSIFRDQRI